MDIGLHAQYPSFVSDFNETLSFSIEFSKNTQISNFTKIRLVGDEFLHAVGRTNTQDEANRHFSEFYGKRPKKRHPRYAE